MQIDPLVVALGAALCAAPILLGLLIAHWRQGWIERRPEARSVEEINAAAVEDAAWRRTMAAELGEVDTDGCDCTACRFWHGWALR